MLDSNQVYLYVGGKSFYGWKSVSIERSMEAASGAFKISAIEINPNNLKTFTISEGDECRVSIGSDTVITGYIDDIEISLDSDSYSFSVSGRDKTCDLVDCSAMGKPEYRNKSLLSIARELCNPFGISVLTESGQDSAISVRLNPKAARQIAQKARRRKERSSKFAGENVGTFRTQPGETVLECLERVAKEKGLLITSTVNGELLLTRSGSNKTGASIIEGKNFISGNVKYSVKDRFSDYIVNGQQGGAEGVGNRWKAFKSSTKDPSVKRFRPIIIMAENAMGQSGAKRRAVWESFVRAAKSQTASVTVPEWRTESGELWDVNTIVNLKSPTLRIDREMLITSLNYTIDDSGGKITNLELKRPDAFKLETDFPIENNNTVKPAKPVKPLSKKPVLRKPIRKRQTPKPFSNSRNLVLNTTDTQSESMA